MAYADQEMSGSKVTSIIIVALIHVAIGYLLISGLAISAVKEIAERVTTIDVEEEPPPEEPEPPPPEEPQEVSPPPPVAIPPPLSLSDKPDPVETQEEIPPKKEVVEKIPPKKEEVGDPPPPPPPPPPPSKARSAKPKNQSRWASRISNNYPSNALRREIEGTVGVSVTVTPKGRAAGCRVTASSGSDILDRAACKGMERYARFDPAWDRDGNPTNGSYSTRITYRLD